ncbi:MAG TPA: hypothetical protein VIK10_12165 [Prolixibacteraceae bacterium]
MTENDKKYGRTFFDIIAEHPRLTFIAFILLLLVLIGVLIFKIPLKVGNVEIGKSNPIVHDTIVILKTDTQYIDRPIRAKSLSTLKSNNDNSKKISVKSGDTIVNIQNQPANINTGINNGIIGDNGTINNNGIQPRKITQQYIELVKANFPDKTIQINFRTYGMADAEIYNVKKQLINFLKLNGYNNIQEEFLVIIGVEPPSRITINKTGSNGIIFEIPPATIR